MSELWYVVLSKPKQAEMVIGRTFDLNRGTHCNGSNPGINSHLDQVQVEGIECLDSDEDSF